MKVTSHTFNKYRRGNTYTVWTVSFTDLQELKIFQNLSFSVFRISYFRVFSVRTLGWRTERGDFYIYPHRLGIHEIKDLWVGCQTLNQFLFILNDLIYEFWSVSPLQKGQSNSFKLIEQTMHLSFLTPVLNLRRERLSVWPFRSFKKWRGGAPLSTPSVGIMNKIRLSQTSLNLHLPPHGVKANVNTWKKSACLTLWERRQQ